MDKQTCNHVLGYSFHHNITMDQDTLKEYYNDTNNSSDFIFFNFCTECGEKLK